jgi:hypothetical protein
MPQVIHNQVDEASAQSESEYPMIIHHGYVQGEIAGREVYGE